jgi:hypothetical protein
MSKNYKIISIKPYLWRAFQQYQEQAPIVVKVLVLVLLNHQRQNCSIFNNSSNLCLNTTTLPYYTPYLLRAFQWHEKCNRGVVVWDISM